MHIIIIGCGRVGARFANVLYKEGHDVVVIDKDKNNFKLLDIDFNGIKIQGVPIDQDVLKQAGIESADAVASLMPDDNVNIMVCQLAKEIFKVPKVIARIYDPDREKVFRHFGLETICPTSITVEVIKRKILGDLGVSSHTIGDTIIEMSYERVTKANDSKKIKDFKLKSDQFLLGVLRNKTFSFAKPGDKVSKDDYLIISKITK